MGHRGLTDKNSINTGFLQGLFDFVTIFTKPKLNNNGHSEAFAEEYYSCINHEMFRSAQHNEIIKKHSASRRKVAFTLAEVLITLGIIGVVAAMTLPVIVQNVQKMVLKNQFKKVYSTFSQGVLQAQSQLGMPVGCIG